MKKYIFSIFVASVFTKPSSGQDSPRGPKIESIGVFYSFIPFSKTYHLKNENISGIKINFVTKNMFTLGLSSFYATNSLSYKYNSKIAYNPHTTEDQTGQKVLINFIGRQVGIGGSVYYEFIERKNFSFSTGIKTSISFFTRAYAECSTLRLAYDSLYTNIHYSLDSPSKTENYESLMDISPDIFLINLNSKCLFALSKQIKIYIEPFISLIGIFKNSTIRFPNTGATIGLTYKL